MRIKKCEEEDDLMGKTRMSIYKGRSDFPLIPFLLFTLVKETHSVAILGHASCDVH